MFRARRARLIATFASAVFLVATISMATAGPASADIFCGPGSIAGTDDNCYDVPQGSYQPYLGATTAIPCPLPFTTLGVGATSVADCHSLPPAGSFISWEGYDGGGLFTPFNVAVVQLCPPGTYYPFAGGTQCYLAPPGSYVDFAGAIQATLCPDGTFSTGGAAACTNAPPGSRTTSPIGATSIVACSPGTWSPGALSSCYQAAPGSYVPGSGFAASLLCAPGSYSPVYGSTSCVLADVDHYVPGPGASYQIACPAGTHQPATGSTSCVPVKQDQAITFDAPANQIVGANVTLHATATSGLPVAFRSLTTSVCDVTDSLVTVSSIGVCTIEAVQDGDSSWNAAPPSNQSFSVTYGFVGFSQPIDGNGIMNIANAGRTIPLKWRLVDANQNPITNLSSVSVQAVTLSCPIGTTADAIEEYTAGVSGLQNLGNGYYQWNWKTPSTYSKSCKTVSLNLGDGSVHKVLFSFVK